MSKCPYCDFNSHALREPVDQGAYVDALLQDLDHEIARRPLPEICSIFIGGGTPSLLDRSVLHHGLSIAPAALVGCLLGVYLLKKMPQKVFVALALGLAAIAALKLPVRGNPAAEPSE